MLIYQQPPAFIRPLRWISYSAILLAFLYIVDDLLGWLGWRVLQNSVADVGILTLVLLLPLLLITWRIVIDHWDTIDVIGTAFGCVFAGIVLAMYTMYPPAGLVTIVIFAVLAYFVFQHEQRPGWVMVITFMSLAFAATTMAVSAELYAGEIVSDQAHVVDQRYIVTQVIDAEQVQTTIYRCNALGILCHTRYQLDETPPERVQLVTRTLTDHQVQVMLWVSQPALPFFTALDELP